MRKFILFNSCSEKNGLFYTISRGNIGILRFLGVIVFLILLSVNIIYGQTGYLGLEGGLEGTATIDNTVNNSAKINKWTISDAALTLAIENSTFRSGLHSLKAINSKTQGKRIWTPLIQPPTTTSNLTIQFYRLVKSTTDYQLTQPGIGNGTTTDTDKNDFGNTSPTINFWEKVTYTRSSFQYTDIAGVIWAKATSVNDGYVYIDDVSLYTGSVDNSNPDVPVNLSISTQSLNSLLLNWSAPLSGVDGGGYLVVRGTADPSTVPNVNGIYAVGNSIGIETVVYQGNGTSFTDTGLSAGTTYYYRIYTYDKAYNYSTSLSANATTAKIEPTNQPSSIRISTWVTTTSMPVIWDAATAGSQAPDGYLVKLSSSSISDPVDCDDPGVGSTSISSGGTEFKTTGTGATFTNAVAGTMYNVKIYSYTNSGSLINFNTNSVPSFFVATQPNQVTSGSITATGSTSANITWNAPSDYINTNHSTLVFVKTANSITTGSPFNSSSTYTANPVFGSGTAYQNDAAATCVYNGDETNVSVTGLSPNTTYHVLIYTVVDATNSNSKNAYSSATFANGTTNNLSAPTATATTSNSTTGFTANWGAVNGSEIYRLDVSPIIDFLSSETANIIGWTFSPYNLNSDIGNSNNIGSNTKTLNTIGGTGTIGTTGSSPNIAASASGWDNGSGTKYWQISDVNTSGMYNLTLSSEQQSSATGPKNFKVQYKIGSSGNWVDVTGGNISITSSTALTSLANLSLPSECENKSSIYFRWIMIDNTSQGDGIVAGTGTSRITHIYLKGREKNCVIGFDDLIVSGTSKEVVDLSPNTTYYYRVRAVGGNSTSGNSNTITVSTLSTFNVTGSSDASIFPICPTCDVTIANDGTLNINSSKTFNSITVAPGGKLTLANGQTLTSPITLQSTALGIGTFVDENTADVPTAVAGTVEQYLTSSRNWYVSMPVTAGTTAALSTATSVQYWNELIGDWATLNSGATLDPSRGYISVATNQTAAITFSGTLNSGKKEIVLTRTTGKTKEGFNLVGNPYPSYLNWTADIATAANVLPTIWYRTKPEGSSYTFYTYNADGVVGVPTNALGIIPPMQAFWVRANAGGGTLTLNNTMRTHGSGSSNLLKAPVAQQPILRLQLTGSLNSDETVVYFNSKALNEYDSYDSPKMAGSNSTSEIYTMAGSEELVINGMKNYALDSEIPLGFRPGTGSGFSIKATEFGNFDSDIRVFLKDGKNNNEVDITESEYPISDAAASTNRFSIIFKTVSITTDLDTDTNQQIVISKNANNQITVNCDGNQSYENSVTVYNAIGQKLITKKLVSTSTVLDIPNGSGVYLVTVIHAGNKITRKVILN